MFANMWFYIVSIIFIFCFVMAARALFAYKLHVTPYVVIAVVLALLLSCVVFYSKDRAEIDNAERWNNGICTECGDCMWFSSAYKGHTYYTCKGCGHTEKFSHIMK